MVSEELENQTLHSEALVLLGVPKTAEEALGDRNWRRAMQYDSLMTNQVWNLVPRPSSRQPKTGKWHFALKMDSQRRISKYKARFCSSWFLSSSWTRPSRNICRVKQGVKFRQSDLRTAYLNSQTAEEIYLEQPEGFKCGNGDLVLKLKRSLYGLKQSGRNWFQCLS